MRSFIAFILIFAASLSWAGVLPDATREALVKQAFSQFWGRAKLSDGSFVQPDNEQERKTLPISSGVTNQVVDAGEVSGLAEWCGLDWHSRYLTMTAAARKSGLKEKQLAFIGVLHGTAQGVLAEAMKPKPCGTSERAKVLELMKRSPNIHF
jgi:hypothetical protein